MLEQERKTRREREESRGRGDIKVKKRKEKKIETMRKVEFRRKRPTGKEKSEEVKG